MPLEAFASGHLVPLLFGHALLEHLMEGHQAVRSSAVVLVCPDSIQPVRTEAEIRALFDWVDQSLKVRFENESEFQAPGADAIFEFTRGEALVGSYSVSVSLRLETIPYHLRIFARDFAPGCHSLGG